MKKNKEFLEAYEARPYHYGRQGQDFRSHAIANIHEYEEMLAVNRRAAELHKKIALKQSIGNNKTKNDLEQEQFAVR